jgi:hypothetical protein
VPARPPVPFNAIPILAPLTAEDRAALEPLCELRAFEKGVTLFEEGQAALFIHFLFVGRVKIVKAAPNRDLLVSAASTALAARMPCTIHPKKGATRQELTAKAKVSQNEAKRTALASLKDSSKATVKTTRRPDRVAFFRLFSP